MVSALLIQKQLTLTLMSEIAPEVQIEANVTERSNEDWCRDYFNKWNLYRG